MKTILNKTQRPIRVPMPRGKVLHLGPNKTGEIAPKAADHPPLQKLVEAGDIEIVGDGAHATQRPGDSGPAATKSQGHQPSMTPRNLGDR